MGRNVDEVKYQISSKRLESIQQKCKQKQVMMEINLNIIITLIVNSLNTLIKRNYQNEF